MSDFSLVVMIVLAIAIGWLLGRYQRSAEDSRRNGAQETLSKEYFRGLNYLLNEQPDQAIDVFIKALEVNSETVETHLSLGGVFRRRGEVDRAIKIHQHLLARPNLDPIQRENAKLALARDYLAAGLLDRAESLLQEIIEQGGRNKKIALQLLLSVYEQEKEWTDAIVTAEKLLKLDDANVLKPLAHYCCELAEQAFVDGELKSGQSYLKRALRYDRDCVRASLMQGQLDFQAGHYKEAIKSFERVKQQDPAYVTESVEPLGECYHQIGKEKEFLKYLQYCLDEYPTISIALLMAEKVSSLEGEEKGVEVIAHFLKEKPSVQGLRRFIDLQLSRSEGVDVVENLGVLRELTEQLDEHHPVYLCTNCGFAGHALHWLCPSCKKWGSVKPVQGLEE